MILKLVAWEEEIDYCVWIEKLKYNLVSIPQTTIEMVSLCVVCVSIAYNFLYHIVHKSKSPSNLQVNRLQLLQNLSSTFNSLSLRTFYDNP
jgi:hypothetical protein